MRKIRFFLFTIVLIGCFALVFAACGTIRTNEAANTTSDPGQTSNNATDGGANGSSGNNDNGNALSADDAALLRLFSYNPIVVNANGSTSITLTNYTQVNRVGVGFYSSDVMVTKYRFIESGFDYTSYIMREDGSTTGKSVYYFAEGLDSWSIYIPSMNSSQYRIQTIDKPTLSEYLSGKAIFAASTEMAAPLFDPVNYVATDRKGEYAYIGADLSINYQGASVAIKITTLRIVDGEIELSGKIELLLTAEEKAELGSLGISYTLPFSCAILNVGKTAITYPQVTSSDSGSSNESGNNITDNSGSSSGGLEGVTDQQIAAVEAALQTYLNTWVSMHATEGSEDQKSLLKNDLTAAKNSYKLKGTDAKSYAPTFTVTYKDGKYTVKASWNQGALTRTFTVQAQTVTYANWAGKHSRTANYSYLEDEDEALDLLTVAFVNSANKVTANAVTGKFGLDGTLGFDAFGANYALRVKGNVDVTSAKDTEIGLVIEDGKGAEVAGIYYKGADEVKNNRVYIQYPVTENGQKVAEYKYIEYADVLGFVNNLLKDNQGNSLVANQAGKGVFAGDIDGLSALLESFNFDRNVSGMIPAFVSHFADYYKDGDRYLLDVNLANAVYLISDIMNMVGNVQLDFLGDIGLDLATMHGLRGHISLSAKVNTVGGKDYLSDIELAVNIPEDTTFYFTADESASGKKLDLPAIGFAIYLEDFSFVKSGETKIAHVVPQMAIDNANAGKGYFSPTNLDLMGDVYVDGLDATFHVELVTDVNPLEIIENGFNSTARAALLIKKHDGNVIYSDANKVDWSCFFALSYEQATKLLALRGTALNLGDDGETLYTYTIGEDSIEDIMDWLGLIEREGIAFDKDQGAFVVNDTAKDSAKAIFGNKLVKDLLRYYIEKTTAADEEVAEASFIDDVGKSLDGIKTISNLLFGEGMIHLGVDPLSLSVNVDERSLSELLATINDTFDLDLAPSNLEILKIEANSEGYENVVYFKLKTDSRLIELTFDNSTAGKILITVKYANADRTHVLMLDTTINNEVNAVVTFDVKNGEGQAMEHSAFNLSNIHAAWGTDNTTEVEALLREIKDAANEGEIFPSDGTGPATKLAERVLGYLSSDSVYPTALRIGKQLVSFLF